MAKTPKVNVNWLAVQALLSHQESKTRPGQEKTLAELGRAVGRSTSQMSRLRSGKRTVDTHLAAKIAHALGVPEEKILAP